MPKSQNIIGPHLKTARRSRSLSQAMLAARCGTLGWDIGENTIAKIETGIRCVTDRELVVLARALRVKLRDVLPGHPAIF